MNDKTHSGCGNCLSTGMTQDRTVPPTACRWCDGTGLIGSPCLACDATGYVMMEHQMIGRKVRLVPHACVRCLGSGNLQAVGELA